MSERFCKICGEYFIGVKNERYCSERCREEGNRIINEDKILKERIKRRRERKPPNKLDEIMRECERLGITYSEYKRIKALESVEKVVR